MVDSHYATTVGRNGTRIQTVEHLMAAAAGLEAGDVIVAIDGEETRSTADVTHLLREREPGERIALGQGGHHFLALVIEVSLHHNL